MGKLDSSLTRVQPVFKQLAGSDPSGQTWLRQLLLLAKRPDGGHTLPLPPAMGTLAAGSPAFEFIAPAPLGFLKWLLENPARLANVPADYLAKLSADTRQKRLALLQGDPTTRTDALNELAKQWPDVPRGAWWALEGPSHVDCALLTDNTVVFIEGKRTELGPSENVVWYQGRNQVLRNLECARSLARCRGLEHFYAVLAVEDDPSNPQAAQQFDNHVRVTDPSVVGLSYPHLSQSERGTLLEHYLGVVTWQEIANAFGLTLP